jgi:hypothetical protein
MDYCNAFSAQMHAFGLGAALPLPISDRYRALNDSLRKQMPELADDVKASCASSIASANALSRAAAMRSSSIMSMPVALLDPRP